MPGLDALLYGNERSWTQRLIATSSTTLAKTLYKARRLPQRHRSSTHSPLTLICIFDTHNRQPIIPPSDLLIHAGDLTKSGTFTELQETLDWLNTLPHKVIIAGNHDLLLDSTVTPTTHDARSSLNWGSVIYFATAA